MALSQRVKDLILGLMGGDPDNQKEMVDGLEGGSGSVKADGSVPFTAPQAGVDPVVSADLATKAYVDASSGFGDIKADGSIPFTGDQSMGSHKLTDVTDPSSAQDAATKNYVDNNAGGAPGGSDTQVQFNDSGSFGGTAGLIFNKNMNNLSLGQVNSGNSGYTLSVGQNNTSNNGNFGMMVGTDNVISTAWAVALGQGLNVPGQWQTIVGTFNSPNGSDIFQVGIGSSNGSRVNALGVQYTGALSLYSNRIINMADPSSAQDATTKAYVDGKILVFASSAGSGGAATEALVVTGLLATDTVISVTQDTPGGNSLPLIGWSTQADNNITGIWSADPGAGSVVSVAVKR